MNKRLLQLFIVLIPAYIFIYLIWIDICPSGIKEVSLQIGEESPYVYSVLPSDRVSDITLNDRGEEYISIINDPTYFNVSLPNTKFDQIEVGLEFNSIDQPIIEVGALTDIYSENYDLKPIYNSIIDELEWSEIEEDGVYLLQREQNFDSVDEFLNNLPDRNKIGVYKYDVNIPYIEEDYDPLGHKQTVDVSLRGYHKYFTYIKDEPFYLDVDYMDMNRTTGIDDAVIRVRDQNENVVFEYFMGDDGDIIEDQVSSKGEAIIDENGWQEGVYSVELSGTSDIFWRSITTKQKYMTFVGKIYIGDDVGFLPTNRATEFYTDAKHLTFETTHADAVQSVNVGSSMIGIAKSHQKYLYNVDYDGLVYCYSSLGDIKIVGDGKFAFKSDMFFNPDTAQLNVYSDIDAQGIDYILTTVSEPIQENGWQNSTALFDINDLAIINDAVKFTISTPGLIEFGGKVNLQAINVRFIKDKMSFGQILSALRNMLPFGL